MNKLNVQKSNSMLFNSQLMDSKSGKSGNLNQPDPSNYSSF